MQKHIQNILENFLSKSSFVKFFYKRDVYLYLDQNFINGEFCIFLVHKNGSEHCGKLRFSSKGRLLESYILSASDLDHLLPSMEKLALKNRMEMMTISREEFLDRF